MTLEPYIAVLTSRLKPEADEIHAVSVDEGRCRSGGVLIPCPTREGFKANQALVNLQGQIAEL